MSINIWPSLNHHTYQIDVWVLKCFKMSQKSDINQARKDVIQYPHVDCGSFNFYLSEDAQSTRKTSLYTMRDGKLRTLKKKD